MSTPRPRSLSLVQMARVDSPCPVADRLFAGRAEQGQTTRFCDHCQLHVHDLSALTADDGETLIRSRAAGGERTCIAYTPDRHGAPISADRPLALARRRAGLAISRWLGARAAALGLTAIGAALLAGCGRMGGRVIVGAMAAPPAENTAVTEPATAAEPVAPGSPTPPAE